MKIDIVIYLVHYHIKIKIKVYTHHRNEIHEHQLGSSSSRIEFALVSVVHVCRCFRDIVCYLIVWHNIYSLKCLFGFHLIWIWSQEITSSTGFSTSRFVRNFHTNALYGMSFLWLSRLFCTLSRIRTKHRLMNEHWTVKRDLSILFIFSFFSRRP